MVMFCDAGETSRQYGRYVDDLRRLFIFHGLSCGATEDFGTLRFKLADSNAFRTDLSALVRSIRDMEMGMISADKMLTVLALASAGEALVDGRASTGSTGATVEMLRIFLSGVGGWRETSGPEIGALGSLPDSNRTQSNGQPTRADIAVSETSTPRSSAFNGVDGQTRYSTPGHGTNGRTAEQGSPPAPDHVEIGPTTPRETAAAAAGQTYAAQVRAGEGSVALGTEPPAVLTTAQEPAPLQRNGNGAARTPIPPSLPISTARDQQTAPDPQQSFARKLAAGFALQSTEPVDDPARSTESSPDASKPSTPFLAPNGEPTSKKATAGESDPEQPKRLVLASPPTAEGVDVVPSDEPQGGFEAMTEDQIRKSRKERIGRRFGIAAVVLTILGLVGVAITLRSPRSETTSSAAPQIAASTLASGQPASPPAAPKAPPQPTSSSATPVQTPPERLPQTSPDAQLGAGRSQPEAERSVAVKAKQPTVDARAAKSREAAVSRSLTGKPSSTRPPASLNVDAPPHKTPSATPPSTAAAPSVINTATGKRVVVPEAAMRRNLISSRSPVYPPDALKKNVVGTVVLNAFIAKDGTVKRIDVVKGPDIFIKSAMSAVSWRRYKPFLVGGKPVEVETPITVSYSPD